MGIAFFAWGVLEIILFFKVWGMTNDVKEIRNILSSKLNSNGSSAQVPLSDISIPAEEAKSLQRISPSEIDIGMDILVQGDNGSTEVARVIKYYTGSNRVHIRYSDGGEADVLVKQCFLPNSKQ